jgi:ABC-type cobalamin/Fe3+-siderophores transport system ATPase subunit
MSVDSAAARSVTRVPVRPLLVRGVLGLAKRLRLLPQSSIAPDGITVADLVARGRFPHPGLIRQWTAADEKAVVSAMAATGVSEQGTTMVAVIPGMRA